MVASGPQTAVRLLTLSQVLRAVLGSYSGDVIRAAVPRGGQLLKNLRAQAEALWGAINQRGILLPAVFVFLWQVLKTFVLCVLVH